MMLSTDSVRATQGSKNFSAITQQLTPREVEALTWMSLGKSNQEIAIIMAISPWTVKIHAANIYKKLNVVNRAQAVARGLAAGLFEIPIIEANRKTFGKTA